MSHYLILQLYQHMNTHRIYTDGTIFVITKTLATIEMSLDNDSLNYSVAIPTYYTL